MIVFIHINIRFNILKYYQFCQENLQKKLKKSLLFLTISKKLKVLIPKGFRVC